MLTSNQENTSFGIRSVGQARWRELGTGKFVETVLGMEAASGGYEVQAVAPGYKPKSATYGERMSLIQFTFLEVTQKVLGKAKHPVISTTSGDTDIWKLEFDYR